MKKFLLITLLLFVLFGIVASAQAVDTIVKDYPKLKACEDKPEGCRPGDPGFGLPEFIKYLYIFSIGAVGLIGMVAIIIAAFDYTMAAGNPQKAALGKDKLLSALLGILLLLGSVVLLNMINPDLLKLRMSAKPVEVDVEGPKEGCQFLNASWNKGEIDAGQSAILTISWDEQSCKGKTLKKVDLPIKHTISGPTFDPTCEKITKEMMGESFPNNSPFTYTYTFNEKCGGWIHPSQCDFPIICNYNEKKDDPGKEIFYLKGTIKVEGQSKHYVPQLIIIVKDLDENDNCCR